MEKIFIKLKGMLNIEEIDSEKLESFINHNYIPQKRYKIVRDILLMWIVGIMTSILGANPIITTILVMSLVIYYTYISVRVLRIKEIDMANTNLYRGVQGVVIAFICVVISYKILAWNNNVRIILLISFIIFMIIIMNVFVKLGIKNIKNDAFKNVKGNTSMIYSVAFAGGALGMSFASILLSDASEDGILVFVALGLLFIALGFSCSVGYLLKYYILTNIDFDKKEDKRKKSIKTKKKKYI